MSDANQTEIKKLRNEVQLLRDELAIFKRKYEDIIYNLDDENFSSRFVREKGEMRTAIEVNAEGIKTKVSNEDFESEKIQTAKSITSAVTTLDGELSSRINQNATAITSAVQDLSNKDNELSSQITQTASTITTEVAALKAKDEELSSKITQTNEKIATEVQKVINSEEISANISSQVTQKANEITATISETYETKANAQSQYNALSGSISSVSQTAGSFSTRISNLETFKTSTFTQTSDGFTLDGDQVTFTGVIKLKDKKSVHKASLYYGDGTDDMNQEYVGFWAVDYNTPMVLGYNPEMVYISSIADNNQVATRKWVLENAGGGSGTATAVFG